MAAHLVHVWNANPRSGRRLTGDDASTEHDAGPGSIAGRGRTVPAACVMVASVALAILVLSITHDPVRGLEVVYIAAVLIFSLHEAHDAWDDPPGASR
jgi:hypothetical protein